MKLPSTFLDDDAPADRETAAALALATALREELTRTLDRKRITLRRGAFGGVVMVVAGVAAAFLDAITVGAALVVLGVAVVLAAGAYVRFATPDVAVTGVERRTWSGYLLPQAEGHFLYDGGGVVEDTEFELKRLPDRDRVAERVATLESDGGLPTVLPRDGDVESAVRADLRDVRELVEDPERISVEVPIVSPDDDLSRGVRAIAGAVEADDGPEPALEGELGDAREQTKRIEAVERQAFEAEEEERALLGEVTETGRSTVTELTDAQGRASELLASHVEEVGDVLSVGSYVFYCPSCLEDEVESKLDPGFEDRSLHFTCPTCEERFDREDGVVPKHRLKDELVEPIWDQLWIEKDDEKRRVYENVEDQKSELEEREMEQKRETIRNAWNHIKEIRSKIRDLETEARAGEGAIEEIGTVMVKYDRLREERKESFQSDVARALEDVEEETQEAIEETRQFEQEKLEEAEEEAEARTELRRAEEEARHRELIAAQKDGLGGVRASLSARITKFQAAKKREAVAGKYDGGVSWGDSP